MNKLQETAQELVTMAQELGVTTKVTNYSEFSVKVEFTYNFKSISGKSSEVTDIVSWITYTDSGKVRVESTILRRRKEKVSLKNLRESVAFIPEVEAMENRLIGSVAA